MFDALLRKALLRCLVPATLALSAVGCAGGGDDNANPPAPRTPAIAKAQLITQADAICRTSDKALASRSARLGQPATATSGLTALAPFFELAAGNIQTQVKRIAALGPPSTDQKLLDDYLDQRRTVANSLRAAAQAVRKGSLPDLEGAGEQYTSNQGAELATRFGFKDCGQPPPPLVPTR